MAATAMQVLPPGFPKIVITPLASGIRPFGPFVGIRDMMVMHSLIDIVGIDGELGTDAARRDCAHSEPSGWAAQPFANSLS